MNDHAVSETAAQNSSEDISGLQHDHDEASDDEWDMGDNALFVMDEAQWLR
jgi:hypothetical protein